MFRTPRGFAHFALILGIVLFLVVGIFFYYKTISIPKKINFVEGPQYAFENYSSVEEELPSDWKTFINDKYGYEFNYPPDWVFDKQLNTVVKYDNPVVTVPKYMINRAVNNLGNVTYEERARVLGTRCEGDCEGDLNVRGEHYEMIPPTVEKKTNDHGVEYYYAASHNGDVTVIIPLPEYYDKYLYFWPGPWPQPNIDHIELFDQIISTLKFRVEYDPVKNKMVYTNPSANFSIEYPSGWYMNESDKNAGFGPKEIREDQLIGLLFYKSSEKTLSQIKSEIGKQFPDRKQTEEIVSINGLAATKVITTTDKYPDWYAVDIIISTGDMFYIISNGAQTDKEISDMILRRTGQEAPFSFEEFYSSFRLLE